MLTVVLLSAIRVTPAAAQLLDEALRKVPAAELADQARRQGDAVRGAVVFFQQHMACSKCHSVGGSQPNALGPDLTALPKDVSDESLVESVLLPSKVIRKGFESVTAVAVDGRTLVGLLVELAPDRLVIRDAARNGEQLTLPIADLESVVENSVSIMPAGQVNQLASRQQFLDLIQYLREIRDGGASRARELQPSPALLTFRLPEYEQQIDHAGFIRDWNDESLQRGEAIYRRVCMNCHGTKDQPGSLPTSLRFADGKFRNGSDPFTMYQTLTRGFGLMAAQTWMVPSQKYDVIHYIRETYLRPHNASQYANADADYLARLPKGNTRGPEPSLIQPWNAMDYGPNLAHTYEVPGSAHNIAYKGIAVRLDPGAGGVARGHHWMLFDTDTLRMAAAWSAAEPPNPEQNFIDWRGIQFNGEHQIHPHIVGRISVANSTGPGWANPATGQFVDDQRVLGRDGLRYGPLPREWAKFRGLYAHDQQVVLSYKIAGADVLELPSLMPADDALQPPTFLRTLNIGPRDQELTLQIAEETDAVLKFTGAGETSSVVQFGPAKITASESEPSKALVFAGFAPAQLPLKWTSQDGRLRLTVPAGREPVRFTIWTATPSQQKDSVPNPVFAGADLDLKPLTHGGPMRWAQKITTTLIPGEENGPFATDILTSPESNPWLAQTRFTGLDFFSDGRMAVCTWDGDVWIVKGIPNGTQLTWQRIATGLFQPLGLKIVNDLIHLTCRDQLAVLHDLNGDEEIDFYECLNSDHQVTEHFHEFAMGLQTDADGNFYYAKSGRHALKAVIPHHGTLLKVSRDGSTTEILATGFRAANGVCLNPDGSFVVTDQEGFWNPKNRINWVTQDPGGEPKFYGNMFGYHDVTDTSDDAMEPPLCWITNAFDRSPGELLWVSSEQWGPLNGSLLNLSYGYGKVFLVPHESVGGQMQGGMIELPIPTFPTGVMRGRFHPDDGQLYLCGMFAWAGSATQPGGLYRLRATGQPIDLPLQLHAIRSGLKLIFSEPLDTRSIAPENIHVKTWSLKRTERYGSDHYDEHSLEIRGTSLSGDGRTLTIDAADLKPTWCMEIRYALKSAAGRPVDGTIHNTIHRIAE
jgi:putative heme-binding domain-containing protein